MYDQITNVQQTFVYLHDDYQMINNFFAFRAFFSLIQGLFSLKENRNYNTALLFFYKLFYKNCRYYFYE